MTVSPTAALPVSSRAAVLRRFGEPLRIECVPVPQAVEPGALLVRTTACSICGTDVHLAAGYLSLPVDLPVILGHEMVGRVIAMGDGSERDSIGQPVALGDRVVWSHTACGTCFFCTVARQPTLCDNRRAYMYESMEKPPYLMGGFSQYGYVLPQAGRVRVPDDVSDAVASLCSCAFRSVMNAYGQLGDIESHEHVVVQGAGPLGLLAAAVARIRGARSVTVLGSPRARLDLARDFGATHTISVEDSRPEDRLAEIRSICEGRGADVVMEFAGVPNAFQEGLEIVRKGGRYLTVGQLGEGAVMISPSIIVRKNIRIMGSFSGGIRSYWQALDFASRHQGQVPFHRLLSRPYRIDEVDLALARMRSREDIKPLIVFDAPV